MTKRAVNSIGSELSGRRFLLTVEKDACDKMFKYFYAAICLVWPASFYFYSRHMIAAAFMTVVFALSGLAVFLVIWNILKN